MIQEHLIDSWILDPFGFVSPPFDGFTKYSILELFCSGHRFQQAQECFLLFGTEHRPLFKHGGLLGCNGYGFQLAFFHFGEKF